jgi:hypothetical protein
MCGRRLIDKSFFDVDAALVGCGHVSGPLQWGRISGSGNLALTIRLHNTA